MPLVSLQPQVDRERFSAYELSQVLGQASLDVTVGVERWDVDKQGVKLLSVRMH